MSNHAAPINRRAEIVARYESPVGYVYLVLKETVIANAAKPGQFVMIRGWPAKDPILPRPFDIVLTDEREETFTLCIKLEGRGTNLLNALPIGETVIVTGPLGKPIDDVGSAGIALLGRGVGAAALVSLAEAAYRKKIPVYSILSARSAARIVCRELLARFSADVLIATDDGSEGYKGNGYDLLDKLVADKKIERAYTCGSRRFAKHVQALDANGVIQGYVFLEEPMACGMGDCHGCAVKKATGDGYLLVCRDGPLFRASEVLL
ncbi:MAG: FAD-binding oxidoreductase [Treponemataceae bacterium]